MRISLLNFICCPYCSGELTSLISPQYYPFQESAKTTSKKTSVGNSTEIKEGLLICEECSHWFPIRDFIPELLPDHLRDWDFDLIFLRAQKSKIRRKIFKRLLRKSKIFQRKAKKIEDSGLHYKKSEISIEEKISDPDFFGPGYSSPFNPSNTEFSIQLIRRFGNVLPLLELKQGDVVLDVGPGYAWTTEWLMKMGIRSIGVDICRTYLGIGLRRMNGEFPYLVIGDVEYLPIKNECLNAVLCFDAFHHIPNRRKAAQHFFRTLKENGNIVLAEPGADHEKAEVSKEVMKKYGILEKGMSINDVDNYCQGLQTGSTEQHFIIKVKNDEQNKFISPEFIQSHVYTDCNCYVIKKRLSQVSR